jgi:hypothetical protein
MSHRQHCGFLNTAEIEDAMMNYLRKHPDAADTLDGIVAWWLPLQRFETIKVRVESALAHLVEKGLLNREQLPDGSQLYALKKPSVKSRRIH